MATVLGYCKKCQNIGEEPRFFEVNTEHSVTICTRCGNRMTPKQAHQAYLALFDKYYKEAEILLFRARDALGAYKAYAKIIDLKPDDVLARYGRILALIYMSTLRKTYFDESLMMFEGEKKYLRSLRYRLQYFTFVKEANNAMDRYHSQLLKRLAYKSKEGEYYFYDLECVSLYFHRILQIRNFKKKILEECEFLKKNLEDQSFEPLIETISKQLEELENELHLQRLDIEGKRYSFRKISENFRPILSTGDVKVTLHLPKIKKHNLENKEGNKNIIKDNVYKDKVLLYKLGRAGIPVFLISAAASIVLFIVAACVSKTVYLFIALATIILSVGVIGAIIHAAWQIASRLSNKYLLLKPLKVKKNPK